MTSISLVDGQRPWMYRWMQRLPDRLLIRSISTRENPLFPARMPPRYDRPFTRMERFMEPSCIRSVAATLAIFYEVLSLSGMTTGLWGLIPLPHSRILVMVLQDEFWCLTV